MGDAVDDDAVWINLKVVASLPPGYRLNTQRELYYHQAPHWWTSVCRTFQGAHRAWCVRRVDALIERTCALVAQAVAATSDSSKKVVHLRAHLAAAAKGIQRLQGTYDGDATTRAALDRTLDKIAAAGKSTQ